VPEGEVGATSETDELINSTWDAVPEGEVGATSETDELIDSTGDALVDASSRSGGNILCGSGVVDESSSLDTSEVKVWTVNMYCSIDHHEHNTD
jgi:hypothetical protein